MPTDIDITLEPMAGLTREHKVIDAVLESTKAAAESAVRDEGNAELAASALLAIRELEEFMDKRLALHIAKEEEVLFPALRLDAPLTKAVDELIEQHDEVRDRHADLVAALEELDQAHAEVDAERARLSDGLRAVGSLPTAGQLNELWETVRRLHWILQGHYGDEEDGLFLPAETLLTADQLKELEHETAELEKNWLTP